MPIRYRTSEELSRMQDQYVITRAMIVGTREQIDRTWAELSVEMHDRFFIARSEDFYLEFMNKQANKGSAPQLLSEELGAKKEETVALGNAQNNDSMIRFVGPGVAMGSSIPGTLKIASVATADNNHDDVGEAIEKCILK